MKVEKTFDIMIFSFRNHTLVVRCLQVMAIQVYTKMTKMSKPQPKSMYQTVVNMALSRFHIFVHPLPVSFPGKVIFLQTDYILCLGNSMFLEKIAQ